MQKKICAVYGEGAVTDQMCQKWFVESKMAAPGQVEWRLQRALVAEEAWRRHRFWEKSIRLKTENHESAGTVKEKQIVDIITRKINQLPEAERNPLEYGSAYIGLNAALCGRIANSLFGAS